MKPSFKNFLVPLAALLLSLSACDMHSITGPGDPAWPGNSGAGLNASDGPLQEIISNGRYLLLYHLPRDTVRESVSAVRITDGVRSVAQVESYAAIVIESEPVYANAYIPLRSSTGAEFTRTGSFFVEFSVRVDARTSITVRAGNEVMVQFSEGRGVLDIEKLLFFVDGVLEQEEDPETEEQIETIVSSGGYIRFFNLPRNASKNSFQGVAASTSYSVIARCSDYEAIAVRKGPVTSEAFVPLASTRSGSFAESGSFFTAFTVTVDAFTQISSESGLSFEYLDGVTEIDAAAIPPPPEIPPAAPHCLTITGLPVTTSPANFMEVLILNSEGVVAKCPDYTKIIVTPLAGKRAALIPLVYDNNRSFNGQDFSDSGSFIVTFSFFPDALQGVVVTGDNHCVVSFSSGSALLDLSAIPQAPHSYLTVSGLPPHIQVLNVAEVFVWNQAGKIGKCENYNLLVIEQRGLSSTLKIPLSYSSGERVFRETGSYYVTFDLNIDALIRINITQSERVLVDFSGGSGSVDASLLPQALPVPCLTITGLPLNTAKNNFTDVFLYNAVGIVARCSNTQDITITKSDSYASASIPLVYYSDSKEYFRDSGAFTVSFTVNVDFNTQIIKTKDDIFTARFIDGSGLIDLASDFGYFSGGLVNPGDTSPPVFKKGTVFEMNGGYFNINSDTPVSPASPGRSALLYVYAVQIPGSISFEYSAAEPVYVPEKGAWYNGESRALYKLYYVMDSIDIYAAKTFVSDTFPHFSSYPVMDSGQVQATSSSFFSLSGSGNPAPQPVTLEPGAYLFSLRGAGGGGGGGAANTNSSPRRAGGNGGSGGAVSELVILSAPETVTVFAGQGGNGAERIRAMSDMYDLAAGGGGGGSGSFAWSPNGYFLCAGGGGGGSAGNLASNDYAGPGGAGGSAGSGGGGGAGFLGNAGAGGGYQGGAGGTYPSAFPGHNGGNPLGFNSWGYDASSDYGSSGAAAFGSYFSPDDWKNTNGANGQGAAAARFANGSAGGDGGNNRNAARGGGAQGGAGGAGTVTTADSAGSKGGDGSLSVHRVF
ncbi:MAG: hypothetical protein LBQ35_06140 [Spirochaetaceae bacterium]|jgi:hypothetical protein|nr:hypothetical protein [Spirochaetaceae bacterium]